MGRRAKLGCAAVSRNPKPPLSTFPDVLNFNRTDTGLYLEKFGQKKMASYLY